MTAENDSRAIHTVENTGSREPGFIENWVSEFLNNKKQVTD
jgi:hypothetical protein